MVTTSEPGLFTIGAVYDCCPKPTAFYRGILDESAIYNYALSATRVHAHWSAGT